MILVTGAAGKTGQAVIRALVSRGREVRALVRRASQRQLFDGLDVTVQVGDLRQEQSIDRALDGVRAIYLMCPNMCPDELAMATEIIDRSIVAGVEHLVYHSVLHPQTEEMAHHWQKLRVEERLVGTPLEWTVLQPAAYMQNIFNGWQALVDSATYAVPYGPAARLSMVDLLDVAEVAATVLTTPGHGAAIYELAGPEALAPQQVADVVGRCLGCEIEGKTLALDTWEENARASGLQDSYALKTLRAMFAYYDRCGLLGNSNVLSWLLGRPATSLEQVVRRQLADSQHNKLA